MSADKEHPDTRFCFIVPVYQCQDTIAQTILSVAAQSYDGWRMLIRDDMSTDNTVDQITRTIHGLGLESRIKLVVNTEKHGEVRNTLEAAKEIEPDEVICRVDGGDWLVDNDGLAMLDAAYRSDPNITCVWSRHRWNFSNRNISAPLNDIEDTYEDVYANIDAWRTSHMKSWRCSAMDGINDANYRDENGDYIMNACDRAIYLPILHKTALDRKRRVHLPACLYHYDVDESPGNINGKRAKEQRRMAEFIHRRGYVR